MINHLLDDLARLAGYAPWLAAPALLVTAALTAARVLVARWRQRRLTRDARLVEIMPPPAAELTGAAVFWAQMLGLLRPAWRRILFGQPHLAWEYVFTEGGMRIQLWVPGTVPPGLVERAVASAWPGAQTRTRPTPPPPDASRATASGGGVMRLARPDHFPLRHDFPDDPLRGLVGAAGMLTGGETVTVQVLARPVTGRRLRRAQAAAAQLRMGHHSGSSGWRSIFDLLTPGTTRATQPHPFAYRQPPEVTADVRHIMDKAAHPRLETLLRYTVTTPSDSPADREQRRGRAHAIAAATAVFTGANHYRRRRLHTPSAATRRRMGRGDLLSVPELAAVAHLPLDLAVPGLRRAPARRVPPTPTVPAEEAGARLLGDADTGTPRSIAVTVAGTRHHTQIIGGTGTGKTTAMFGMALSDVDAGRAMVLIEPKGESDQLLDRLPEDAGDRLVLFDPQLRRPPSLNVLHGGEPSLVADTIVGIFARIYADHWGPRTDDVLRSACLTLATHPATTLADIPRLLGDPSYRRRMTEPITDPALKGFWTWFESLSPGARAQATGPIMNKLRAVLLRRFARAVLAAGRSTVDLGKVFDTGGIVLARLPKGVLGEDTSRLLGSLILAQVWQAVLARAPRPEHRRPDLSVYVDECHNFLTLPHGVDDMLAEARAYHCGLVLAHQHLAQLPTTLREAIAANARNKLIFAVSPEDASSLTRHVHPNLDAHDLAHLDRFQAAARVVHQHALAPACTLRTRPLPKPVRGRAQALRTASQARYGGPSLTHHPQKHHTDPRTHLADDPDKG